jgi:hypothetical protein
LHREINDLENFPALINIEIFSKNKKTKHFSPERIMMAEGVPETGCRQG